MNRSHIVRSTWLGLCTLLVLLALALIPVAIGAGQGAHADRPVNRPLPPNPIPKQNLLGWTYDEIAPYAIQQAQGEGRVLSGTPQVLLTRQVRGHEMAALGLECLIDTGVIEEPPMVLVAMKGDFDSLTGRGSARYLVYIFDLWAAAPLRTQWSADGSHFKKLLGDPALPDRRGQMMIECPQSAGPRTEHYGEQVPVADAATPAVLNTPTPNPTAPAPVPTGVAPLP